MPELARGAALESLLQELHASCDLMELPDARVLVDGVAEKRKQRLGRIGPSIELALIVRRGVAVMLKVWLVTVDQDLAARPVVYTRGYRQGCAILAPRLELDVETQVLAEKVEGLAQGLDLANVAQRQLGSEIVLHRPVDIVDLIARENGDEASKVVNDLARIIGESGKPRFSAEVGHEPRLA